MLCTHDFQMAAVTSLVIRLYNWQHLSSAS